MKLTEKQAVELDHSVAALKNIIDRFVAAAMLQDPSSRMKMLEVSIEVQPAMERVVKAATGKD